MGPQLIIKQKKTAIWYAGWGTVVIGLLAISFYIGRYIAVKEREETLQRAAWLEQKLKEYQQAYQKANEDLVMQTQSAKVDNKSNQQLVETVKQLQDTQRELEAELSFYRNIMAPELAKEGLTIADLELSKLNQQSPIHFKLMLTQAGKQEQFLKGEVILKVAGTLDGNQKVYQFRELGAFQSKDFQFQFRYFQNIEGAIVLPTGFVAQQVTVTAKTRGLRKNQSAEKQFEWNI
ncbi:MAG: hypothetical protein OQJ89_15435 [Kangiellaceae bacterium]|nr:hypothetical protein [Kangiellaceae bacterium]MCW9018364.1 hypothetical protein [Kangiellaceae bacterium]